MKNIPNILSIIRTVLACVVLILITVIDPANKLIFILVPGVLFLIGCLTDFFDGYLARKNNFISDFGKFIDPIADKVLTFFTMLAFMYIDADKGLPVIFIAIAINLLRELSIASLRMLAAVNGVVIAADQYGKLKTVLQMIALGAYFLLIATPYIYLAQILLGLSVIMTILSGYNYIASYIKANRKAKS